MQSEAEILSQFNSFRHLMYDFYAEESLEKYFSEISSISWTNDKVYWQGQIVKHTNFHCRISKFDQVKYQIFLEQNDSETEDSLLFHPMIESCQSASYENQFTAIQSFTRKEKNQEKSYTLIALRNNSIRIISNNKLVNKIDVSQPFLFNWKSPFAPENLAKIFTQEHQILNEFQVALIPLKEQVTVLRYCLHLNSLLCGCQNGRIYLISFGKACQNLTLDTYDPLRSDFYQSFQLHNNTRINDMLWLSHQRSGELTFASTASDNLLLMYEQNIYFSWKVQQPQSPHKKIQLPENLTRIIQVRPGQLITTSQTGLIRFWDINRMNSYVYQQNTCIISTLLNLTDGLQSSESFTLGKAHKDPSLRYITGSSTGQVTVWRQEKEFLHLVHQSKIVDIDYLPDSGMFICGQKAIPKISIFKPVLSDVLARDLPLQTE